MKVYISLPMADKTKEQIKKDRELAIHVVRLYYPDCEILDTFFEDYDANKHTPLEYMTKCTELMSQADLCFFAPGYYQSTGCCLEDHLAQVYGVKRLYLDYGLDGIGDNTDPYQFVYQPVAILRED